MKRAMQIIAVLVSILFTVSAMAQGNITLKGIVTSVPLRLIDTE